MARAPVRNAGSQARRVLSRLHVSTALPGKVRALSLGASEVSGSVTQCHHCDPCRAQPKDGLVVVGGGRRPCSGRINSHCQHAVVSCSWTWHVSLEPERASPRHRRFSPTEAAKARGGSTGRHRGTPPGQGASSSGNAPSAQPCSLEDGAVPACRHLGGRTASPLWQLFIRTVCEVTGGPPPCLRLSVGAEHGGLLSPSGAPQPGPPAGVEDETSPEKPQEPQHHRGHG